MINVAAALLSSLAPDIARTSKHVISDFLDNYGTKSTGEVLKDVGIRAIRNFLKPTDVSRLQEAAIDSGGRVKTALGGVAPSGATPMESLGMYQPGMQWVPAPGTNLAERNVMFSTQGSTMANNRMPVIMSRSAYNKKNTRKTKGLNRIPEHGPSVSILSNGTAGGFPQQHTIYQSGNPRKKKNVRSG